MLIKTPVKISDHARTNMSARGVTKDEVFACLLDPEKTYTSRNDRCFVKGQICVVAHEERHYSMVKTVLYAGSEQWNNSDVRSRKSR